MAIISPTVGGTVKPLDTGISHPFFCAQPLAGTGKPLDTGVSRLFFAPCSGRYGKTAGYRCLPSIFCAQKIKTDGNRPFLATFPVHQCQNM